MITIQTNCYTETYKFDAAYSAMNACWYPDFRDYDTPRDCTRLDLEPGGLCYNQRDAEELARQMILQAQSQDRRRLKALYGEIGWKITTESDGYHIRSEATPEAQYFIEFDPHPQALILALFEWLPDIAMI